MADVSYVCLYVSYLQSLSPFTDAECGRIVKAMLHYASTGEAPQFDGNERFLWPSLQAQIDRDMDAYQAKCSRNKANGAKGGRPPQNPTVIPETERFFEKPKKPKEKEKENEKGNEKENEKEHIGADRPPEDVDFGRFWAKYPKKVGKQAAKKAFHRVNLPVETLLSAIERQKGSIQWSKENGQFIPNPATWLAQGRWEDELQTKEEANGQAGVDAYSGLDWSKCGTVV